MPFRLRFSREASAHLTALEQDAGLVKRLKAVRKCLGLLEANPRYPELQSHKFHTLKGPGGAEVFEVYAENRTSAAWRVFYCFGPNPGEITILAITAHP